MVMVCDSANYGLKPFLKEWVYMYFYLLQYSDIFITKYLDIQVNEEGKFNFTNEKEFYFVSKGPVISRNL